MAFATSAWAEEDQAGASTQGTTQVETKAQEAAQQPALLTQDVRSGAGSMEPGEEETAQEQAHEKWVESIWESP